uniref:Uncharacterized protein n=1 Tax=Rhizophora mucronata TaxID=61149 RepID=A0A2P2PUR2_RHIMU
MRSSILYTDCSTHNIDYN